MSGSSGELKMDIHKIRQIVDFIRSHGRLPTDPYGQTLSPDDLLAWFGLTKHLTPMEQKCIKKELIAMIDAEVLLEQVQVDIT